MRVIRSDGASASRWWGGGLGRPLVRASRVDVSSSCSWSFELFIGLDRSSVPGCGRQRRTRKRDLATAPSGALVV